MATPIRDAAYMAWIATLPCAACYPEWFKIPWPDRQKSRTEVAHVGDRGLGQKCSDRETIPLCMEHHRTGKYAHHVIGKRFWEHHGLDRAELVRRFNKAYEEQRMIA